MKPEATFSKWFCSRLKEAGAMAQRIETSTGQGVPDIAVLWNSKTRWVELKWDTRFIRAVQYVWAYKALKKGVHVLFVIGKEDKFEIYDIEGAIPFPKTQRYKLTNLIKTFPKNQVGMNEFMTWYL